MVNIFLYTVAPQIAQFSFGDEPVNAGDMSTVNCAVTKGDLPMEIVWMFKGKPIGTDRMDMIVSSTGKRVKQLAIEAVAAKHAGEYTCVASNTAGSTSRSAILNVNGILMSNFAWVDSRESLKFYYTFNPFFSGPV